MMETRKVKCRNCEWHGDLREMLEAYSPFDGTLILGCPACKVVNSDIAVCDEDGCWDESTCGTRTPNGYRRTCGKHVPVGEGE